MRPQRRPSRHHPSRFRVSGIRGAGRNGPTCRACRASAFSLISIIRRSTMAVRTVIRPASMSISPGSFATRSRSPRPSTRGAAGAASAAPTAEPWRLADFTDPYYRTPARFAARRDYPIGDVVPERLEGKKVGVVAGTAHEAYLKAMFTEAEVRSYPTAEAARDALRQKEVDLLFDDGIALAFWLNGTDSAGCCAFRGGPFLESRFFGEGVGIAVKRGNDLLRLSLNWALFQLWEKGSFTDLWLRYFPISPF